MAAAAAALRWSCEYCEVDKEKRVVSCFEYDFLLFYFFYNFSVLHVSCLYTFLTCNLTVKLHLRARGDLFRAEVKF